MAADSNSTKGAWRAAPMITLLYAAALLFRSSSLSASIFCFLSLGFAVGIGLSLIIQEKRTKTFLAVGVAVVAAYVLCALLSLTVATGAKLPFTGDPSEKLRGLTVAAESVQALLVWLVLIPVTCVLFPYVASLGRQFGYWLQERAYRAAGESKRASLVPIAAAMISAAASVLSALIGGK